MNGQCVLLYFCIHGGIVLLKEQGDKPNLCSFLFKRDWFGPDVQKIKSQQMSVSFFMWNVAWRLHRFNLLNLHQYQGGKKKIIFTSSRGNCYTWWWINYNTSKDISNTDLTTFSKQTLDEPKHQVQVLNINCVLIIYCQQCPMLSGLVTPRRLHPC